MLQTRNEKKIARPMTTKSFDRNKKVPWVSHRQPLGGDTIG